MVSHKMKAESWYGLSLPHAGKWRRNELMLQFLGKMTYFILWLDSEMYIRLSDQTGSEESYFR